MHLVFSGSTGPNIPAQNSKFGATISLGSPDHFLGSSICQEYSKSEMQSDVTFLWVLEKEACRWMD